MLLPVLSEIGAQGEETIFFKVVVVGGVHQAAALPQGSPQECNPVQGTAAGAKQARRAGLALKGTRNVHTRARSKMHTRAHKHTHTQINSLRKLSEDFSHAVVKNKTKQKHSVAHCSTLQLN